MYEVATVEPKAGRMVRSGMNSSWDGIQRSF